LEVIGHKNDPKTDILSIIYEHEIKKDFSEETIKEVENISFELKEEDHLNRRDIRDKKVFTIDGDDAKDFDDALSIDVLENGNYLVGIHIADVTHYIKEGGALEKELVERGTSVYLANSVIPMIPKKLSNDICSLNPNVDRLCLSLNVELDKEGKIKNYEIYESVINSKKRMTYKEVNEILDNKNVVNGYENFVSELELLNLLSKKLISKRKSRGGLDFNIPEQKWIVDDNDEPIELLLRTSGTGEKLIEAFMILANEVVAEHVFNLDLPFIYRVHEKPELEKVKKFLILLNNLGYKIAVKIRQITPKDMQMILDKIKDSKIFSLLSEFAVRSTKKAEYKVENLGHFGLASRIYTHFTSPIRRSPDCSIHGVLKKYLKGQRLSSEDLKIIRERLIYISERASYKERQAIECERDVNDMLSAKYMSNKIGQEFDGIIAGIIPNGMFVRLENYIEGMVRLDSLDDYYVFDEPSMSLRGRKSKKSYKLGDKIRVKTVSTSKEEKTIDFEVVKVKKWGRMKSSRIKKGPILILIIIIILVISLFVFKPFFSKAEEVTKLKKEKPKTVSLLLVGDVLLNDNIIKDGIYKIDEYDFNYIFNDVKGVFDDYDLKHYFQKNLIVTTNKYTNYKAPKQIANSMIDYGFNLVALSNSNIVGNNIEDSINFWETKDIAYSGFEKEGKIYTIDDVSYGFFSYTTRKNDVIKYYEKDNVSKEILKIKDKVDFIIVSIDWKENYSENPTAEQEKIAKELSDMGVDIIVGSNSTNIKPIEIIDNTIVFYSLGNFLVDNNIDFSISAICSLNLRILEDKIEFDFINVDLSYVYSQNKTNFKIKLFEDLDDEILNGYKTYYTKYSNILTSKSNMVVVTKIGD